MTTPASPRHSRAEVIRTLQIMMEPGGVTELRALNATLRSDRRSGTISGYFDAPEKLADALAGITSATGVYFVMNPVNPALTARAANRVRHAGKGDTTSDTHVTRRRWLLVDLDPVRVSGISSTDAEHDLALQRAEQVRAHLRDAGWPEPILADSGNGYHLLYRIDHPAEDGGIVQSCLAALACRFDDRAVKLDVSVCNPARITKLYGTVACKGDATADRPHRLSKLVEVPEKLSIVPESYLLALAAQMPGQQTALPALSARASVGPFDLDAWMRNHLPDATGPDPWNGGQRWTVPICPFNPDHTDGSAYVVRLPHGPIGAGCHHNSCQHWGWHVLRELLEPAAGRNRSQATATPTAVGGVPVTGTSQPIPAFVPFPVDVLPEPVRSFVIEGAKAIGCDMSYVAVPLIPAIAAAIGNTYRIRLKLGWEEAPIVWTGIVGESGTMKTPAFKLAMQITRAAQKRAFKDYKLDSEMWETNNLHYEADLAAWKQRAKQGKASDDPPKKPEVPVAVRYHVSDTTVEALAPILESNPRGVILNRDELSGWLASFDRYVANGKGGGDAAHWLSMHNGEAMTVDRKSGNPRVIHVPTAAVSITGGIQPGRLAAMMGKQHRESGMLARVVFADPPRKAKRWTEAVLDPATEAKMTAVMGRLFGLKMDCDELDPTDVSPKVVDLSPEGKAAFIKFYNEHADEQFSLSGDEAAAWSKLEGYAARFALIIHLLRWAAGDPSVPDPMTPVDEKSVAAGVVMTRWFGAEAMRVYATLDETEEEREIRELVDWIARHGGSVTVHRLTHDYRRYKGKPEKALSDLNLAAAAGYGVWEVVQNPKGGPPTDVFKLHQSVPVPKTPETHVGFEGSGDGDTPEQPKDEGGEWGVV